MFFLQLMMVRCTPRLRAGQFLQLLNCLPVAALVLTLLLPAAATAAQNLVGNGSFENRGLAPWQSWQNLSVAGWGARSGQYAARAGNHGGGDTVVDVVPGARYRFTAWGRIDGNGTAQVGYELLDTAWQRVGSPVRAVAFTNAYEARSLSFTVPANVTRVKLIAWNANADAMFLDDVSLVRDDETGSSASAATLTSDPAGPQAAALAGTVNSLDTVINDMALMNDLPLVGVNPAYGFARGPGFNIMGNNPSGSGLPSWYRSAYPQLANTGYWKGILPWFVLFHGQGNGASNTRVQMRDLKMYILSRSSNQWRLLTHVNDVSGEFCPQGSNYNGCLGGDSKRSEPDGGVSIKPRWGQDFHGWYGARQAISGWDVKAVFVTMQARLTVDNPWGDDDRGRARYLFDVGADYYPEMATSPVYLPGVGVSRAKLITPDWQSFNFITLSDVGKQEPGGGITQSELRQNPPPLD